MYVCVSRLKCIYVMMVRIDELDDVVISWLQLEKMTNDVMTLVLFHLSQFID